MPVFATCVHPQIIGQPHHIMWYEEPIDDIAGHDGVWFATLEEIAKAWVDDETDEALFNIPDVGAWRRPQSIPAGSEPNSEGGPAFGATLSLPQCRPYYLGKYL